MAQTLRSGGMIRSLLPLGDVTTTCFSFNNRMTAGLGLWLQDRGMRWKIDDTRCDEMEDDMC